MNINFDKSVFFVVFVSIVLFVVLFFMAWAYETVTDIFKKEKERGIDVQLFVRKNKDDKISKEFYYLGRMTSTGVVKEFVMPNTDKTAVEIEWHWILR